MWKTYAFASAFFAALTAIFAKLGVRDVNSDLATAIRTLIILFLTWGIVLAGNHLGEVRTLGKNTWIFLILSGVATGLSWLFYFKALQNGDVSFVAPVDRTERGHDHHSFLHHPGRTSLLARHTRRPDDRRRKSGSADEMTRQKPAGQPQTGKPPLPRP